MIDKSVKKKNYGSFSLSGAVDGFLQEDCVLEVKNRTRRLFRKIPEYEQVQLQAYIFNFDKNRAILLECKKNPDGFEMNSMSAEKNQKLWDEVLDRVNKLCSYLTQIIQDAEVADRYVKMTTRDRQTHVNDLLVYNKIVFEG